MKVTYSGQLTRWPAGDHPIGGPFSANKGWDISGSLDFLILVRSLPTSDAGRSMLTGQVVDYSDRILLLNRKLPGGD